MQKNSEKLKPKRYKPNKLEIYGSFGVLKLGLNFLRTKLYMPSAKLFKFPIEIRGKKYIDFGRNLTLGKGSKIEAYPYINKGKIIKFGSNVGINDYAHITGVNSVTIGNNVLIAGKVFISDTNHGSYYGGMDDSDPESIVRFRPVSGKPIFIDDNVWIGESVAILSGVTIGRSSIIGANSVVTKDIPPYTIAAGAPAIAIKKYNFKLKKWIHIKD